MKNLIAAACTFTLLVLALGCSHTPLKSDTDTQYKKVRAADYQTDTRTHSDAIEAAQKAAHKDGGTAHIVLDSHDWIIDRAVLLNSDTILEISDCTLKLADSVHDNIIRNSGISVDANNPNGTCKSLSKNRNIKIIGSGNAAIEGPEKPYRAYNPNMKKDTLWTGDFYGWRTVGILLAGVENYEIANLKIRKTLCWAISQEWGCRNGYLHDIEFSTNVKNGDGIDFRNGCRDCLVENIRGITSDDTVACTALDPSLNDPKYLYPMQAMGYAYSKENSISNIRIRNIFTTGNHHGVICLSTSPKVENIEIENVIEPADAPSKRESCVKIYTGYGSGYVAGNLSNITVKNVESRGARYALQIKAATKDVRAENIIQHNKSGERLKIEGDSQNLKISE